MTSYLRMRRFDPALDWDHSPSAMRSSGASTGFLTWEPRLLWAVGIAACGAVSFLFMQRVTEFLYFQF